MKALYIILLISGIFFISACDDNQDITKKNNLISNEVDTIIDAKKLEKNVKKDVESLLQDTKNKRNKIID